MDSSLVILVRVWDITQGLVGSACITPYDLNPKPEHALTGTLATSWQRLYLGAP